MDKESIVLGSGDLYCTDFQGTNEAIPDDAVIETEDNRLGHIKGGAEIEYAPEFYEAKDDMGKVSKVIITEEEATLKSGIMTWCGTTLEKLCQTARVTETKILLFVLCVRMAFRRNMTVLFLTLCSVSEQRVITHTTFLQSCFFLQGFISPLWKMISVRSIIRKRKICNI